MYIIVGYSFSLGDDYITKMLLKAIREDPEKQLIIINKDERTIKKFREYVERHVVNFNEKNFYDFVAPAEEVLPKAIEALMKPHEKEG